MKRRNLSCSERSQRGRLPILFIGQRLLDVEKNDIAAVRCPNNEDWNRCTTNHLFGDATREKMFKSPPTVRSNYESFGACRARSFENCLGHVPRW